MKEQLVSEARWSRACGRWEKESRQREVDEGCRWRSGERCESVRRAPGGPGSHFSIGLGGVTEKQAKHTDYGSNAGCRGGL